MADTAHHKVLIGGGGGAAGRGLPAGLLSANELGQAQLSEGAPMRLADRKCAPCRGAIPPMARDRAFKVSKES